VADLRTVIPTHRQQVVGDRADERVLEAQEQATVVRRRLRLRDLDPRAIEGPKRVLLILGLTSLFARVDEQAFGVLLPQIRAEFGVNLAFLAALSSLVGILATLSTLPAGFLADRVRRVWLVAIGAALTGATVVGQGLAQGVGSLVGARLANGAAQGIAPPATFTLQTDWFPASTRSRVFSLFFAAGQAGLVLGPIVAGLIGDAYGWRPALLLLGGLAVGAGLLVLTLREPVRGAQETATVPAPLSFRQAYRAAASISTVRRCWYATPFLTLRGLFTYLVLPAYFSEVYGFSTFQLGLYVSLTGVSGMLGLLVAGAVGDRILAERPGRYLVVLGGVTAMQAGLLVLLSFAPSLAFALVVTQGAVIIETALQPAFYTLISLVVPVSLRGLGVATNAPWQILGLIGAPFVFAEVEAIGLQRGILVFVPLLLLGGAIVATGAGAVERDLRAVRASEQALATSEALLVCRDVAVAYDGVPVLFGLDLEISRGEIVALVGTNGAGKSTLLRAISGTQEASGGAIVVDGIDITHLPPHEIAARGVVMMPGGNAVFPSLTVAENLSAATWTDPAATTDEVLELFPVLRTRLEARAGTLSGGEQQMVGLAQALMMAPTILLVDELSLGLAPQVVDQLLEVLRRLNADGTTIVLVEQSLNVALTIAHRAVFLEKGTVRFDGTPAELLARPDLVRSVFLGAAARGSRVVKQRDVTAPTLEVAGIGVRFGGITALDDVGLSVQPGQVVGIIGPNGAGKTTLFDVLSGFVRPTSGTVSLAGTDISALSPDARARLGLGRSFQNARLFPTLTVRENIAVALERRTVRSAVLGALWAPQVRSSERRIARQVDRLVELLGLEDYATSVVGELSTGSRRAVDVACIIALEPSVLLLDEPSSGLAQAETEALGPLLSRIVRETGCGMLVIEHDLALVTSLADELIAMDSGRVVLQGAPDTVLNDPRVLSSYLAASGSRSGLLPSSVQDR
jgi:ABC-type branched-subunit amino acid transport system ATPase component/predicted MFS family arabinose efflux permease